MAERSPGAVVTRSFRGAARGANLIDLRVLDANGMSNDSVIISALEQAVKLKARYNITVINLSVGRPILESANLDPLCKAVAAAWRLARFPPDAGRGRWLLAAFITELMVGAAKSSGMIHTAVTIKINCHLRSFYGLFPKPCPLRGQA